MTDAEAARKHAYFELAFSPNVELVSTVREFVHTFYKRVLADEVLTSRMALATHEMLENAVKYAADGSSRLFVQVERQDPGGVIVAINTRNRANPAHLADLKKMFDELRAASDPMEYYQTLMRRSAKRTHGSGLGLGRIRAEADMELEFQLIDGDIVSVWARTSHALKPRTTSSSRAK